MAVEFDDGSTGGNGTQLTKIVIILAGIASLGATLISILYDHRSPFGRSLTNDMPGQFGCKPKTTGNLSSSAMSFASS